MRETNDMWLATNFRLRRANDFQALETFALTEATCIRHDAMRSAVVGCAVPLLSSFQVKMQKGGLSMDAIEVWPSTQKPPNPLAQPARRS